MVINGQDYSIDKTRYLDYVWQYRAFTSITDTLSFYPYLFISKILWCIIMYDTFWEWPGVILDWSDSNSIEREQLMILENCSTKICNWVCSALCSQPTYNNSYVHYWEFIPYPIFKIIPYHISFSIMNVIWYGAHIFYILHIPLCGYRNLRWYPLNSVNNFSNCSLLAFILMSALLHYYCFQTTSWKPNVCLDRPIIMHF